MINTTDWFFDNLENKDPFCYVRFNDGEMMGIHKVGSIAARGDQYVDQELSSKLIEALKHRQENYYIGIPCKNCYPFYHDLAASIVKDYQHVTSAVLLTNRNWKNFYERLPVSLGDRPVVWIGGQDQDPDKLKKYGINIKKTLRLPNKNSWSFYEKLKDLAPQYFDDGDVVCVSLGPTARVVCSEWYQQYPKTTFIDMGSLLDPVTRDVWFGAHKGWEETGFNLVPRCKECN